ncbi:hypothetical protein SAMN05216266_1332 [Amycolatopsis marina]|uniref:Uncharacterized protein n=1 Tax=Amycolatopsis marina TaxID=490629 RepID=A0A1I1CQ65_9PSEU|nr:hypothetical protein [Amycolatopsis marina]SFB63038.1 hypothetical protein SAMN05216266_1332 [Amycolatopsis marina]
MNDTDTPQPTAAPNESCEWCGKVHDNPVRVDPFTLGGLARSLGAEAFSASCELINQRARGL